MGQSEILELLEKKLIPLARTQIAELLNEDPNKISVLLKKLKEQGEIKDMVIDKDKAIRFFNSKRRLSVFFSVSISKDMLRDLKKQIPYL